jgi:hypothetical protein
VKVPVLLVAKFTEPEGVAGLVEVSVTVAVQVVVMLMVAGVGRQTIVVVVVPTITRRQPLDAGALLTSPL